MKSDCNGFQILVARKYMYNIINTGHGPWSSGQVTSLITYVFKGVCTTGSTALRCRKNTHTHTHTHRGVGTT